jgi:tripeptide aminopeptidase
MPCEGVSHVALAKPADHLSLRSMCDARVFHSRWFLPGNNVARQNASALLQTLHEPIASAAERAQTLDSRTLAWQLQLARIPSPTGNETVRAAALVTALKQIHLGDVHTDAAGNVIARTPSPSVGQSLAPVVCMAHLDTVFPFETALDPRHEGTRVICPGIGDNGRGLAALLAFASVIGSSPAHTSHGPLRRPIELVATVGEEGLGNLRGARAYFADRSERDAPVPHAVVAIDGPGDARIVHQALGSRRFRVDFRGGGGHSWSDFGTPNAVHAAGRATAWLAEMPRTLNRKIALTVSGIGGGESVNSIPAHAFIEIDLRGTDDALLKRSEREIQRILQQAVDVESRNHSSHAPLEYELSIIGNRPCGSLSVEHPLVALAQMATISQGIEPMSAVASTDANIPLSLGIPAITIGAGGSGGGAHTLNEWYDNTNGPRGIARALAIVIALAA